MKQLNGLLLMGFISAGLVSSTYTGQEKLDQTEQIARTYSEKTMQVVELVKTLQSEKESLLQEVSTLNGELDRNWNTVEDVNQLIDETKVLRHVISVLEEQNAQLEEALLNDGFKEELDIANQSTETHLETMTSILDEAVFEGVLETE